MPMLPQPSERVTEISAEAYYKTTENKKTQLQVVRMTAVTNQEILLAVNCLL